MSASVTNVMILPFFTFQNKNTYVPLNRTLPSLGHSKTTPIENATLPLHNSKGIDSVENHLSKTTVPSIDLQKSSARKGLFVCCEWYHIFMI